MKKVILVPLALILVTFCFGQGKQRSSSNSRANYGRPFETRSKPAFILLPPGTIEPSGWLHDWSLSMRDGFTIRMKDVDTAFQQAWAADYKMTGQNLAWPKGGWPYEGGAYWFDGLARLGFVLHDTALLNQARSRFDAVVKNMNDHSILFMWWLDRNNPDDIAAGEGRNHYDSEWPLWANGSFGRSLTVFYEGTHDKNVLKALEQAYSGESRWLRMGFAPSNVWPAFQTYTWSGSQKIKNDLDEVFENGGVNKGKWSWDKYGKLPDELPWMETADHGVHVFESTPAWALGYLWTGKKEFLQSALKWHEQIANEAMQPYGVPVGDEFYGPTGAERYSETCTVVAYMWSEILLLQISGKGYIADQVERAFFNAAPAVVSRDCRSHVYLQSPNRLVAHAGQTQYKPKHFPLCCTATLNRMLPNYIMNMWMATYDNGLAAMHYGPCKLSALVADSVLAHLNCETDYPFNENINITIHPEREVTFPISFRIPGWCLKPGITINGESFHGKPDSNGFVRIQRIWKKGDIVRLHFPMQPVVQFGIDHNSYDKVQRNAMIIPQTSGTAPYATVSYGPLLFALPILDTKDSNAPDKDARWKFAFDEKKTISTSNIKVERHSMPIKWDWPLESPLKLKIRMVEFDWNPDIKQPLPSQVVSNQKGVSENIELIPYGCTKFRISMFPVTESAWKLNSNASK